MFVNPAAKPIWINQTKVNHYVDFKTEFEISEICENARLYIAVDTEYAVYINGTFVNCGAYDDFPNNKSYDVLNIAEYLKIGKNELFITAYAQGIGSFQYISGTPFLLFSLECGNFTLCSNEKILCRENPHYLSGDTEMISFQMAYTFTYNVSLSDTPWQNAVVAKITADFYERPIKKCIFNPKSTSIIKAQGKLIRKSETNTEISAHIKTDYLSHLFPSELYSDVNSNGNITLWNSEINGGSAVTFKKPTDCDGVYIVIDLKKMQAGHLNLEMTAEEGATVEIGYGESIDDMRVRSYRVKSVGKYICREGAQSFTHRLKRLAGRYLELHITNIREKFTLNYCGFIPMLYPVKVEPFNTDDRLFKKIYDVSVNTLITCMHEHYEDCPIREQGLYGFDGLNQMLCGYYAFKETDMPKASLRLLAEGLTDIGLIPLCAPSKWDEKIPLFSVAWIFALEQYLNYSGDINFAKEVFPIAEKIINTFKGWLNNGIIETTFGNGIWNFYDWDYGLDDEERNKKVNEGKIRIDAPLNFGFCAMLKSVIRIAEKAGISIDTAEYNSLYDTVKANSHKKLYNSDKGLYVTYIGGTYPNHYCELSQALALISGVSDDPTLRQRLADRQNGLIKTNLSLMYYKYEALLQESEKYLPFILDEIEEIWGNMVYSGATTCWETTRGEDDFDKAASLCHGWSAIPIYIFKKYLEKQ